MQKLFRVTVDISKKIPAPAFEVNTNDLKSVKLEITITNSQSLLDLTDVTPRINIRKPDNEVIFQDCEIVDAKAGKVQIVLENQAYLVPGTHTAEIACYKGSEITAITGTFSYKSIKGIMNDQAVESKSEFTAIDRKIEEARKLLEDIGENGVGVDEQARQEIEGLTEQLADTVKEVNGVKPTNGKVTLPIPEVDTSNLATKQELANTVKKGENGVLNLNIFDESTRAVLQGLEPGQINAVLGEGNVTPQNTTFIQPSPENIYDYTKNTDGIRFGSTGVEVADATFSSSEHIKVQPGTYTVGFPDSTGSIVLQRLPFYDLSKTFVSLLSNGSTFTSGRTIDIVVPSEGYIRVAPGIAIKHLLVVARKENFKGLQQFKWTTEIKSPPSLGSVGKDEIVDKAVTTAKTDFIATGKNLFNKSDVTLNSFYANFPGTTALSGYYTVNNPMKLKPSTTYTLQKVRQYYLTDMTGAIVDSANTSNNNANVTITTPNKETLLYMSGVESNLDATQVEEGTAATTVEGFRLEFPKLGFTNNQVNDLKTRINSENAGALTVVKNGETFTLTSDFNLIDKIKIVTQRKGSRNNSFNFVSTEIGNVTVHANSDDIVPIRTFTTVGANHGYTTISIVTMSGHGKTNADLGSKWTDGKTTYTLLQINGNDLVFGCPYTVDDKGIVSSVEVAPTANLTHVSGATNTAEVNVSNKARGQLYPSINNISVKYLLDGKEITKDGTYNGNELQVVEHYNIMDYKAIIDYAQSNIGKSFANDSVAGVVRISNNFTFSKGLKCTTSHGLRALKPVNLGACGFLQSIPMNVNGYSRKRFMPGVKPKNGYDFANGIDLNTYNTSLVFSTADYVDPNVPPSHTVDWLYDTSGKRKYGFSLGYIVDKTKSKNSERAKYPNAWDMRDTTKNYPIAIEGVTLNEGEYLNFAGFRNYLSPEEVGEATSLNVVKDKKDTYLYAIFNQKLTGINKELNDDIGKGINAIQTNNVNLLNDTVDVCGVVLTSTATPGSAVMKIN